MSSVIRLHKFLPPTTILTWINQEEVFMGIGRHWMSVLIWDFLLHTHQLFRICQFPQSMPTEAKFKEEIEPVTQEIHTRCLRFPLLMLLSSIELILLLRLEHPWKIFESRTKFRRMKRPNERDLLNQRTKTKTRTFEEY